MNQLMPIQVCLHWEILHMIQLFCGLGILVVLYLHDEYHNNERNDLQNQMRCERRNVDWIEHSIHLLQYQSVLKEMNEQPFIAIVTIAFGQPIDHKRTFESSEPLDRRFGSTELKSTLQQRFSCSLKRSMSLPVIASHSVTAPSYSDEASLF